MNITLRQVQAFVTTAKRGSVSRAAEEMGMTQAAVSSLIRQIEETSGLVLFERASRRVTPTDAGHRLLALGTALIAQHTAFLNGLRDEARSREKSVAFAVSPALAASIVPKALRQLAEVAPELAKRRVLTAHLGSGASICAMLDGKSRDSSMGFSTLDGVPMATRPGALDAGVILHLVQQLGWSIDRVDDLLYHRSGLIGMSGISADSRDLVASPAPEAAEALAVFAFRVARELSAAATTIGGVDALVFTAGIGEHQPPIRAAICAHLAWLGVAIDAEANAKNALRISTAGSPVTVFVLPTDEEQVIATEAADLYARRDGRT
eukprot:gene24273-26017_t